MYQPIIEQQKAIRDIDTKILEKQNAAKLSLERIVNQLQLITSNLNPGSQNYDPVSPF